MGKDTIVKTTVEFIVRGKETYYALIDLGKTRKGVIDILKGVVNEFVKNAKATGKQPGELTAKFIFKTTREKPIKLIFNNISVSDVVGMQFALIEGQKTWLQEVIKASLTSKP